MINIKKTFWTKRSGLPPIFLARELQIDPPMMTFERQPSGYSRIMSEYKVYIHSSNISNIGLR